MKRRSALLAAMALLIVAGLSPQSPAKADPRVGLRFLLGSWEAKTTGGMAQAQSSGAYAYRLELRDHLFARRSSGGACKGPEDFDCQHSDLLYIYPAGDGQTLQAIYFDNEGHVLHYDVTTPRPEAAVFLSDPAQPGPQFRLSYELAGGLMTGSFNFGCRGRRSSRATWSGPGNGSSGQGLGGR